MSSIRQLKIMVIVTFLFSGIAFADDDSKAFMDANSLHSNGEYQKAIEIYDQLLARKKNVGELHYNLGNSLFRNGELGKAIFHYIKAKELLPRNADVKFNLNYARSKATDKIDSQKSFFSNPGSAFKKIELLFLTVVTSLVFWISMGVLLFRKNYYLGWIRNISLISMIISVSLWVMVELDQKNPIVVTSKKAHVYSTIGKNAIKLFTLHEGAEGNLVEMIEDKWALFELADGKKGWIEKAKIIYTLPEKI